VRAVSTGKFRAPEGNGAFSTGNHGAQAGKFTVSTAKHVAPTGLRAVSTGKFRAPTGKQPLPIRTQTRPKARNPRYSRPHSLQPDTTKLYRRSDRRDTIKVTSGSEAQKSGLRDGDLFLSLNDVPFEKFNYCYYEYLERLGEPMQLKVRREGKDLTLIFPPTVVIP
jgi:hypothetical protein